LSAGAILNGLASPEDKFLGWFQEDRYGERKEDGGSYSKFLFELLTPIHNSHIPDSEIRQFVNYQFADSKFDDSQFTKF